MLLAIVFFSYRQTIDAYPHGGGSYTVATENLGDQAGLLAAAALMIDYILNAAVGISAGVGALVSAFPALLPHTLALCLGILAILTLINMRGVKDTGTAFLIPTYLFIASLLLVIGVGALKVIAAHGHPLAVVAPPRLPDGSFVPWDLADAESVCQRMYCNDRCGGSVERGSGISSADPEEREGYADDDHRPADGVPGGDRAAVPGIRDRCHGSKRAPDTSRFCRS